MRQKSKTNWWIVAAVIIIGVPLGFVIMGVIDRKPLNTRVDEKKGATIENIPEAENDTIIAVDTDKFEEIKPETKPVETKSGETKNDDIKSSTKTNAISPKKQAETPEQIEERRRQEEIQRQQEAEKQRLAAEQQRLEQERQAEQQRLEKERQAEQQRLEKERVAEQQRLERELKAKEEAERQRKLEEEKRKEQETLLQQQEELRKQEEAKQRQFLKDVENDIKSKSTNSKIVPEECVIVVNDTIVFNNYQNFRNGVIFNVISEIEVIKVDIEEGNASVASKVTKIYVKAKINNESDDTE